MGENVVLTKGNIAFRKIMKRTWSGKLHGTVYTLNRPIEYSLTPFFTPLVLTKSPCVQVVSREDLLCMIEHDVTSRYTIIVRLCSSPEGINMYDIMWGLAVFIRKWNLYTDSKCWPIKRLKCNHTFLKHISGWKLLSLDSLLLLTCVRLTVWAIFYLHKRVQLNMAKQQQIW